MFHWSVQFWSVQFFPLFNCKDTKLKDCEEHGKCRTELGAGTNKLVRRPCCASQLELNGNELISIKESKGTELVH